MGSTNDLPWFPMWADRWVGGTAGMPYEAMGMYITLLCYQWGKGQLPREPEKIAALLRVPWPTFEPLWTEWLAEHFPLTPRRLHRANRKLVNIRRTQLETHKRRSKAGKKGRAAQSAGDTSKTKQDQEDTKPGPSKPGNPGQNMNQVGRTLAGDTGLSDKNQPDTEPGPSNTDTDTDKEQEQEQGSSDAYGIGNISRSTKSAGESLREGDARSRARAKPQECPDDFWPDKRRAKIFDGVNEAAQREIVHQFIQWAQTSETRRKSWQLTFAKNPVVKTMAAKARAAGGALPQRGAPGNGRSREPVLTWAEKENRERWRQVEIAEQREREAHAAAATTTPGQGNGTGRTFDQQPDPSARDHLGGDDGVVVDFLSAFRTEQKR